MAGEQQIKTDGTDKAKGNPWCWECGVSTENTNVRRKPMQFNGTGKARTEETSGARGNSNTQKKPK